LQELNTELMLYMDPVFSYLFTLFSPDSRVFQLAAASVIIIFVFFILAAILLYFSKVVSERSFLETAISSALLTGVLWIVSQGYLVVYLLFFPLLLLCLATSSKNLLLRTFLYFWGLLLSGPLSLFYACIAGASSVSSMRSKAALVMTPLTILVGFLLTLYFSTRSILFDYPGGAQVMFFSPFTSMGNVCIGPDRIPFSVHMGTFLHENLTSLLLAFVFLIPAVLPAFVKAARAKNFDISDKRYSLVLLLLMVLLSSIVSHLYGFSWAHTAEASLIRCFPGLVWRPLPFFFSSLFVFLLLYYFLSTHSRKDRYVFLALQYALLLVVVILHHFSLIPSDMFRIPDTSAVLREFSPEEVKGDMQYTPSAFLVSTYFQNHSDAVHLIQDRRDTLVHVPLTDKAGCHGTASRNSESVMYPLDGKHKTRWSTGGPQNKGDWYEISCENPVSVSQIHLSIVFFKSDFPRGLRLEAGVNGEFVEVVTFDEWFGSVQFTPAGLPYFGPQSDVVIDLPEAVTSRQFRFTLTRGDPVFDWSIAKILFLHY
jgi:hypothetical protein